MAALNVRKIRALPSKAQCDKLFMPDPSGTRRFLCSICKAWPPEAWATMPKHDVMNQKQHLFNKHDVVLASTNAAATEAAAGILDMITDKTADGLLKAKVPFAVMREYLVSRGVPTGMSASLENLAVATAAVLANGGSVKAEEASTFALNAYRASPSPGRAADSDNDDNDEDATHSESSSASSASASEDEDASPKKAAPKKAAPKKAAPKKAAPKKAAPKKSAPKKAAPKKAAATPRRAAAKKGTAAKTATKKAAAATTKKK